MRATGQKPVARRAELSASKPTSTTKATPRRALTPVPAPGSALLKRAGKTTVGIAAGAILVGGLAAGTAQPAAAATKAPTLRIGDSGNAVVRLQKELTAAGRGVRASGYFGTETRKKVNRLKQVHGWKQDGVAGAQVWDVLLNDSHKVSSPSLTSKVTTAKPSSIKAKRLKALAYAKAHLGDPYSYGAAGPSSFDCSGLTMAAYHAAGIKLQHNSTEQYSEVVHVAKKDLAPGDLVFFYSGRSHVAIYAGHGKVIHAGEPGEPIEYIKMSYMPYNGAGRPA